MENFRIIVRTADGEVQPVNFPSCRAAVEGLVGTEWGRPLTTVSLEATAEDGTRVSIHVPYDESDRVSVSIEEAG